MVLVYCHSFPQVAYRKNKVRKSIITEDIVEEKQDSRGKQLVIYCYSILPPECSQGPNICAHILTFFSLLIIIITLPLSLCFVVKVVQVIPILKQITSES